MDSLELVRHLSVLSVLEFELTIFDCCSVGSTFGSPAAAPPGQGTANPPFQAHLDKDGGVHSLLQSISAMPAYAKYSFEVRFLPRCCL